MSIKKLKKTMVKILAVIFAFAVAVGVFWLKEIVFEKKAIERCARPALEENILMAQSEKISLGIDAKRWDLELSEEGIVKIEEGRIVPLSKGRVELIFKKKGSENCTFSSEIFVVNFQAPTGFGSGRI